MTLTSSNDLFLMMSWQLTYYLIDVICSSWDALLFTEHEETAATEDVEPTFEILKAHMMYNILIACIIIHNIIIEDKRYIHIHYYNS
uniref:Uncharacterized protein n=1 Tax=Lactuca sativa TaxID=4236 RepID=A0A9R1WVW7_LACSA|nr:hypothetical protein LSAT_V11C800421090 [Lactuca sativa]